MYLGTLKANTGWEQMLGFWDPCLSAAQGSFWFLRWLQSQHREPRLGQNKHMWLHKELHTSTHTTPKGLLMTSCNGTFIPNEAQWETFLISTQP